MKKGKKLWKERSCGLLQLFPACCTLRQFLTKAGGDKVHNLPYYDKYKDMLDEVWLLPKDGEVVDGLWQEKLRPVENIRDLSIAQIINVAVAQMVRSSGATQNVLCYGYRQKSMNSDDVSVRNWLDIECRFVNTVHSMFMTSAWRHFAAAIGTDCFRQLLDFALFLTASNGSFLQICGPPANALANKSINSMTQIKGKDESKLLRFHIFYNTSPFRSILPSSHSLLKNDVDTLVTEIFGTIQNEQTIKIFNKEIIILALRSLCSKLLTNITYCDAPGAMRQFVQRQYVEETHSGSDTSDGTDTESIENITTNKRKRTRRGKRSGIKSKRSKIVKTNVVNPFPVHATNATAVPLFNMTTQRRVPSSTLASSSMPTVSYIDYLANFISNNVQTDAQHASFHTQEDDMQEDCTVKQTKPFETPAVINQSVRHSQMSCSHSTKKNKKNKWRKKWRRILLRKSKSDLGLTQTTDILAEQTMIACEERKDMLVAQCHIDCGNNHHINRLYRPTIPPKSKSVSQLTSSSSNCMANNIPGKNTVNPLSHCKVEVLQNMNDAKDFTRIPMSAFNKQETVSLSVPKAHVAAYVKAILRRLLPHKECWGSRHNVNHIMRTVDAYIHLGRHETMTVNQATTGVQLERIPWLQFPSFASQNKKPIEEDNDGNHGNGKNSFLWFKQSLFTKFMSWLFGRVIGMLLAQAFYVTEAEGHGTDIFYYQKHIWRKIVNEHYPEFRNRFVAVNPFAKDDTQVPNQQNSNNNKSNSSNNDEVLLFQRSATVPSTTHKKIMSSTTIHNGINSNTKKSTLFNAKIHSTVTSKDTGGDNTHYQQQRTSSLQSWSMKIAETSHLSRGMSADQWKETQRLRKQQQLIKAKQFSSIRFVPKKTGLRGITNLRTKPGHIPGKHMQHSHSYSNNHAETPMVVTNSMLYNCLHVLKHVYDTDVSLRGFGVFGMDDIYREYRSYWNRLAEIYGAESLQAGHVPLYMAAVDLEKCYDNIDPVRLYDLIQNLLLGNVDISANHNTNNSTNYNNHHQNDFSRSYSAGNASGVTTGISSISSTCMSRINSTTNNKTAANNNPTFITSTQSISSPKTSKTNYHYITSLASPDNQFQKRTGGIMNNQACLIHKYAVTHTMRSMERVVTKHLKYCVLSGETISFADAGPEIANRYRNSVIYDAVMYNKITAREILRILKHHLFAQIVRMPSTLLDPQKHSPFCMQVTGIPQGSILSPVLCHLYYGHVENNLFFNTLRPISQFKTYSKHHSRWNTLSKPVITPLPPSSSVSNFVNGDASPVSAYEQAEAEAEQAKLGWWKTSLPEKTSPQTMVIRLMDDYLIISTHASCVQHFLQTAFDSYGLYGGKINPSKTKVNFPVTLSVAGNTETMTLRPPWESPNHDSKDSDGDCEEDVENSDKTKTNNDSYNCADDNTNNYRTNSNSSNTNMRGLSNRQHYFSWCGLLIDTHTMEIRPDLTRLLSRSLTTSVSIESSRPGVAFRRAIKSFFRMKCHALILDNTMHRLSTVIASLLNLYQLTAARTFAYYQRLHSLYRVNLRPGYVVRCLREGILFAARLISTRMRRAISRKLVLEGKDFPEGQDGDSEGEDDDGEAAATGENQAKEENNPLLLVTHFGDCAVTVKMAIYLGWKAFREVAIATHFRLHPLFRGAKKKKQQQCLRKEKNTNTVYNSNKNNKNNKAQTVDIIACCEENLSRLRGSLSATEWQALQDAWLIEANHVNEDSQLSQLPRF